MNGATLRSSVVVALLAIGGCAHNSDQDALIGRWTNHHRPDQQPEIVSIEFFAKNTMTIDVIDALAAAGWHSQTASTGQYEVIAPGKLRLTETAGGVVIDYRVKNGRLILSGHGLAQVLGTETAPQALDKSE